MAIRTKIGERRLRLKAATLWISAVIIFIVATMAILVVTNPIQGDERLTPAQMNDAVSEQGSDKCDVSAGDTSATPQMPEDLRWEARNGWTWPVSDTYGPTKRENGYGVCFARSPLGAALMAVAFHSAGNTMDARQAFELYLADSPGKDVQLRSEIETEDTPLPYSGFIVDSFTPDRAQVTLVFPTPDTATGFTGLPLTFRWVDGDWKQELLDDGSLFRGQPVSAVRGDFVEWGVAGG